MRSLNIKYIPELDQLRGIAALLVFYFHAVAGSAVAGYYFGTSGISVPITSNALELVIANGFSGVALFFVISGFLFTWGALGVEQFDWKKFYVNRVLRIFPLYVLVLLVAFCLARGEVSFGRFVQSLLGFGNLTPAYGDFDIVLWTISVELQFYMLFPFLISLLKRKGAQYLGGLIGILIIFRFVARLDNVQLHDPVYWTLLGRLDQFLVGMILAWLVYRRGWLRATISSHNSMRSLWLAGGLVASCMLMLGLFWLYTKTGWKYGESYFLIIWPPLEAAGWALIGAFYVGLVRLHRLKFLKSIQFVGMVSFSFYMLHYPVVRAFQRHPELLINIPEHRFASGLLTATIELLPISLLVALLTYYVIEKPPLDLRRQYATFTPSRSKIEAPAPSASGSDA